MAFVALSVAFVVGGALVALRWLLADRREARAQVADAARAAPVKALEERLGRVEAWQERAALQQGLRR